MVEPQLFLPRWRSAAALQPLILKREANNTGNPKLWLPAPSNTHTITLENYTHSGRGGSMLTWQSGPAGQVVISRHARNRLTRQEARQLQRAVPFPSPPSPEPESTKVEEIVSCSPHVRHNPSVTQQIILPALSVPLRGRNHPPVVRRGGKVTPPAVCSGQ